MNHFLPPPIMTERTRTTISLDPEVLVIFKRMADAANMSVSRCMGDWLTDTADAAEMITLKMEEAKKAPLKVMREMRAMVAGMSKEVDAIADTVREARKQERDVRQAQPGVRSESAAVPPSSNTGVLVPSGPPLRAKNRVKSVGKKT